VYSLPPGYLAVTGQVILASQHNPSLEDLAAALTNSLPRNGAAPMIGHLDMGGFKVTNAGEGTADGDYVTLAQLNELTSAIAAATPTGTVLGFRRTTAPTGWIKENGGTIGNAASGATTRANSDTEDLFTLLWGQFDNTALPIQTSAGAASTRGASAAADYAANKRMPLFDSRSRFHRGADDGLGFDASLTVGAVQADAIKNHVHPGTTASSGAHTHTFPRDNQGSGSPLAADFGNGDTGTPGTTSSNGAHTHTFTTDNNTGGLALETRVRASVVLVCIKL
jgi:hypothetical protein